MDMLELGFWLCLVCVLYTYAGYPLILALWSKIWPRPTRRSEWIAESVSLIVAARNEEETLPRRLDELASLIKDSGIDGQIIVVSDGSTDNTALVARGHGHGLVTVVELEERVGKGAALTEAARRAKGSILVFADARQSWHEKALTRLLENFADERVGAVSGDLVVTSEPGFTTGVGMYWQYEKWLRKKESLVHSSVGVTGAICAVRRELFGAIPKNILLDDVYWPLRVVMSGKRVIHDKRAEAYDRLPERTRDEFRRKVRTLSGNFQLIRRLPSALIPIMNPVWFQFISHKVLRLVVPWALLAMLAASFFLPAPFYQAAFWTQVGGYALCALGLVRLGGARVPILSSLSSFLVLNAAAWLAFWVYLSGHANRSWNKTLYQRKSPGFPRELEASRSPRNGVKAR
jgi:biofilm PGA synthesis N-glycosyltransferase PgaC